MAAIRIFLLTCRRPHLLPRALASLCAQTFTDWICELHNDAPEDDSPSQLLASLNDPRITLHQHETNWGPVRSFNHAFTGGPEPFASLLEDDNTWDPAFLATALAALNTHPAANVVWANLRYHEEQPDGSWRETGRTIWSVPSGDNTPRLIHWPQPLQLTDALHSNGAMLFRTAASARALVPASTPFAIIEPVRERLFSGGWLFLPQPLGTFALTLNTSRSPDPTLWAQSQLLVAASFIENVCLDSASLKKIWAYLRAQNPPSTPLLFLLACSGFRPRELLRPARLSDWLRFLSSTLRHPLNFIRALRFRSDHPELWSAMRSGALARTRERPAPDASPIFSKSSSTSSQRTSPPDKRSPRHTASP